MTDLITEEYSDDHNLKGYGNYDTADIRNLLLGHRIEKITDDHMMLDDGTVIRIVPNNGCGGCSSGHYQLTDLNDCDNVITAVDFEVTETSEEDYMFETVYRVFVVAEDKRINLFAVTGSDGNGYYGTGYELLVRAPGVTP